MRKSIKYIGGRVKMSNIHIIRIQRRREKKWENNRRDNGQEHSKTDKRQVNNRSGTNCDHNAGKSYLGKS